MTIASEMVKHALKHFSSDLQSVEAKYAVPVEVIVSLWGIESVFGKKQGTFKIIPSLATLAYKSHRREFFRKELIRAVQIVEEGHIELENLTGFLGWRYGSMPVYAI